MSASHVDVLDADDVVGEVGDGHIAVGAFDVGDIFAVPGSVDLGTTHLVGNIDAALDDGHQGSGAAGVSAACVA